MPLAIGLAIGQLLFAVGAPLAVVNFAVFTLGGLVVNALVSVGLSLAVAALQRGQSPLPTPSDGQQEIRQPLSPRVRSYGTVRVAGAVWWFAAVARVLYLGLAVNHGRIGSFVSYIIDENQVDLDVNDKVTSTPYSTGNVFIHHRTGLPTETKYGELLAAFGVDQARGDGVASVLATFENPTDSATFQNTYPNGRPSLRVTINASVAWDPRASAQLRGDPSTWQFSDNPVVCLLDYLTSSDGFGVPYSKVEPNLAQWVEAMDACDALVPLLAGGFSKKYRVAGSYRLTDAPSDVLAKFTSCCDGRVWAKRDGTVGVAVGVFAEPTVALTQAHVTGWSELTRGQDPLKSVAGVRGEYMSPEHDYREHEAEPWPTGELVDAMEEDRVASLDLLWVPSNSQARRLMKRHFKRVTAEWRGVVFTNAYGLKAMDERYVRLAIPELDLDTTFEVVRFSFDPASLACQLEVVSVDATIDDWAASEEGAQEASALAFVSSFSKTGTAVDVLVEAGGQAGQYAIVFASNTTGNPGAPAGWSMPTTAVISGIGLAVYGRKLDGTEGSLTFNNASGALVVFIMRGVNAGAFVNANANAGTGVVDFTWNTSPGPSASFAFGAGSTDFDLPDWVYMMDPAAKVSVTEHAVVHRTGSLTAQVKLVVFDADEVPPAQLRAFNNTDQGSNGLVTFNLLPA